MKYPEPSVFSLGWLLGCIRGAGNWPSLVLASPAQDPNEDCPTFLPAQSITVYGKLNLEILRDKINEYLKAIPDK